MTAQRRTGFVCHELYMWHDTGNYAGPMPYGNPVQPDIHAENPETKRRFRNLMEVTGMAEVVHHIKPRAATEAEILRFHTPEHLKNVQEISAGTGGDAGFFTPAGRGSYEIAMLSAGGVLAALEAIVAGDVDNAYALVRPPGHHAIAGEGMGFCIFGNAALAGFHAFETMGMERIAYVDWDVHHGNGTQDIFYERADVLFCSLHGDPDDAFPHFLGYADETGAGSGVGYNRNYPMPPGTPFAQWRDALVDALRHIKQFAPQFLIVSLGVDTFENDPISFFKLTTPDYLTAGELLADARRRTRNHGPVSARAAHKEE